MKKIINNRYFEETSWHDDFSQDRLEARANVNRYIKTNGITEKVDCFCGKETSLLLAEIDRWGIRFSNILCTHCGQIRVTPRWSADTYETIYKEYFWILQRGSFDISRERFDLSVARAEPSAQYLTDNTDLTNRNILEIGCSYGALLQRLKAHSPASLTGYDYDVRMLQKGREYADLDLHSGGLEAALKSEKKYDLVILRHVFEHFLDPVEMGRSLRNLLTVDGELYIEVPGILNECHIDKNTDPIADLNVFHTYTFTLKTLTRVMNICGFELITGDDGVSSLWKLAVDTVAPSDKEWSNSDEVERIVERFEQYTPAPPARRSLIRRIAGRVKRLFTS